MRTNLLEKFKDVGCVLGHLVGLKRFGALIEVTGTFAQQLNNKPPIFFRAGSAEWWLVSFFSGDWRRLMRVRLCSWLITADVVILSKAFIPVTLQAVTTSHESCSRGQATITHRPKAVATRPGMTNLEYCGHMRPAAQTRMVSC